MGDCDVAGVGSGARAGGETGVAVDWFVACGCGFAALLCRRESGRCPCEGGDLLANVLLSGLKRRDVSRGLTLVTGDFFNSMPKYGEIAHYRLQLLQ